MAVITLDEKRSFLVYREHCDMIADSKQKLQSETKKLIWSQNNESELFRLQLNCLSRIVFHMALLTVNRKHISLFSVIINVWRVMRSQKTQSKSTISIGDEMLYVKLLSSIEIFRKN